MALPELRFPKGKRPPSEERATGARGVPELRPPPPPMPLADQFMRGAGITARGALPIALGAAAGAPAGPVGIMAGGLLLPAAEAAAQGWNLLAPESLEVPSPTASVENLMTSAGLPVPETMGERIIQSASGALTGAASQLGALGNLATSAATPAGRELASMLSYGAGRQLAAAPVSAAAQQATTESTGNPLLGMAAGVAAGAPFSFGLKPYAEGPSSEQLQIASREAFNKARDSGAFIPEKNWDAVIRKIKSTLSTKGFNPKKDREIAAQIASMEARPAVPWKSYAKRWDDLEAYRTQIQSMQKSADGNTRRLATDFKWAFDDAILDAPSTIAGQEGMRAWADARNAYSRMMKGEVFEDMISNAEMLGSAKFTQSGKENALAAEVRRLAQNPKKMRLFTAAEQKEIYKAAKGGTLQNLLKWSGKFAPTSALPAAAGIAADIKAPGVGKALAAGGMLGRLAATKIREDSIVRLADMMRSGGVPPTLPLVQRQAPTARGLLAPIYGVPADEESYGLLNGGL